jgi:hypothetical protein
MSITKEQVEAIGEALHNALGVYEAFELGFPCKSLPGYPDCVENLKKAILIWKTLESEVGRLEVMENP